MPAADTATPSQSWPAPLHLHPSMSLAVGSPPAHRLALACADGVGSAFALVLSYYAAEVVPNHFVAVALAAGLATPTLVALAGGYTALRSARLGDWVAKGLLGLLLAVAAMIAAAYLSGAIPSLPRIAAGIWCASAAALMIVTRIGYHAWRQYRLHGADTMEPVLLAGRTAACGRVLAHLRDHPWLGLRVIGMLSDGEPGSLRGEGLPIADLEDAAAAVQELKPRRVLVCGSPDDHALIGDCLQRLAGQAVAIQFIPDLSLWPIFCLRGDELAGMPALTLAGSPLDDRLLLLKEIEDRVLGSLLLLAFSPLLVAIALAIRLGDPGPALFVQPRHGLHGRLIHVYKFRTMRRGGGGSGSSIEAGSGSGFRQATTGDARVTRLGRLLRASSLDELPQLINVVKGEMSLVGPRPHPVALNEQFRGQVADLMRRHLMKPGITGLAQVSGARGATRTVDDMRRRVQYDLEYIRSWSLWLDLRILARTAVRGWINREP